MRAGKGFAGAMVVLVPKNPEADRELFRRDQSDLDGTFLLRNVIPGSYTLLAIQNRLGPGLVAGGSDCRIPEARAESRNRQSGQWTNERRGDNRSAIQITRLFRIDSAREFWLES